jgi:hypothetical protein
VVQRDLAFLVRITDILQRKTFAVISRQKRPATQNAIERCGSGADLTGAVRIFVAPHAIDVVIVDHADGWKAGVHQCLDDIEVGHLMHVNDIRVVGADRIANEKSAVGGVSQLPPPFEDLFPSILAFASAFAVKDANFVAFLF